MSILLYLVCLILINYLAIGNQPVSRIPAVWSALFWTTILFTMVNTIAKSFIAGRSGANYYLYSIASPESIILSKILYGFFLSLAICFIGTILFFTLLSNPIEKTTLFLILVTLASFSFSASLTLLSSIAAKTDNSSVVMAVLSFPVIMGTLLLVIKVTKNCIDGLDVTASSDEMTTLFAINLLVTAVSYLLFPYIWRS